MDFSEISQICDQNRIIAKEIVVLALLFGNIAPYKEGDGQFREVTESPKSFPVLKVSVRIWRLQSDQHGSTINVDSSGKGDLTATSWRNRSSISSSRKS
jgi:hypothetical protein